jgi:hypothetical protein
MRAGILTVALLPLSLAAAAPEERGVPPAEKQVRVTADGGMVVESHASSTRTAQASGRTPLIGFIDSQAPYCTQPDPRQDSCFVNVASTSVSASPNYITNLHMFIENKLVFRAQGFFQTSLYVDASNAGLGFRVACGPPREDSLDTNVPKRQIGNSYSLTVRAEDSAGLKSANYASITCPPYYSSSGAPVISVLPASLASTQLPGTQSVAKLTIGNTAAFPLWWNLPVSPTSGCGSAGVPWLSVGLPTGSTGPLASQDAPVTFNSTGLTPGHYSAHVCVQSGDTYSPQIDVPVALTVTCPIGGPLAITASPSVGAGSPGRVASVRPNAGSTFAWTITNGTITAGQGTNAVTFTAGTAGTPVGLGVTETNPDPVVCVGAAGTASIPVLPAGSSLLFFPVTPCRLADTRLAAGPLGGPALAPSEVRLFKATASCNIPPGALGVSMNVTVAQPATSGFFAAYPGTATYPGTSTLSFRAGQTRADATVIGLATDGAGTFRVLNGSAGTAHVIVDVNGYFY